MPAARLTLALLLATVAIAATACGGGSDSVPSDAVAVVDGTEITKEQLDEYMMLSKKSYERSKQAFPKAGTPEYQNFQSRNVALLVEIAEYEQAADDLGVKVTKEDIDKVEDQTIETNFGGKRADYEKALKATGVTRAVWRRTAYASSALYTKVFEAVTKGVEVSDQEILEYYTTNQSQYGAPESRDVRHILIAEQADPKCKPDRLANKTCEVDFEASKAKAGEVYAQLKGGADFAALAKQISDDTGTKESGGKLTISRGQTVPEFDKVSFDLKTGELSKPVKTSYGYHVIEAVSDVRKATATPIDKVRASIRTTLLQEKRNQEMLKWDEDLKADYDGRVSYAAGYEPPELPEEPTDTQ
jgi:parvulin-like peptidyl-prolyl isomerase